MPQPIAFKDGTIRQVQVGKGANLAQAVLTGMNLRGVDLTGADLRGANLVGVDLRGANLSNALYYSVDLIGAILV